MSISIYRIIAYPIEQVIYIGQTQNPRWRFHYHISSYGKFYGMAGLHFEVIEEVDKEIATEREIYWTRYYKKLGQCQYNLMEGHSYTEEFPVWNKGKTGIYTEETRKAMGRDMHGELNPMWKYEYTDEQRKRQSDTMKQYYKDHPEKTLKGSANPASRPDVRKKISESRKGYHWYTNGVDNIQAKECPEGFIPGRVKGVIK